MRLSDSTDVTGPATDGIVNIEFPPGPNRVWPEILSGDKAPYDLAKVSVIGTISLIRRNFRADKFSSTFGFLNLKNLIYGNRNNKRVISD